MKRFLLKAVSYLIHHTGFMPLPRVMSGPSKARHLGNTLKELGCKKPLIVTDEMLVKHGLVQPTTDSLVAAGIKPEIYDKVVPNPPADLVEEGFETYTKANCDSIVAFGGGSPMDVAKVVAAKVANPKCIESYEGYLRVSSLRLRTMPTIIAVPTTAGTGSEATAVAVITRADKKIVIVDMGIVPPVAVLDPELLVKLPKSVIAATGMDTLTHAVESYLAGASFTFTRERSLSAVEKVFGNLLQAYHNPTDLKVNENMLNASLEAGIAFTRASLGYVHAIAHQFGGLFHTPHGIANAMVLPHILEFYLEDEAEGSAIVDKYCELAVASGLVSDSTAKQSGKCELARRFVEHVFKMNEDMSIPREVKEMKASDVEEVATRALQEAHGEGFRLLDAPLKKVLDLGYPVPKYMTLERCKVVVSKCLPAEEQVKVPDSDEHPSTYVPN